MLFIISGPIFAGYLKAADIDFQPSLIVGVAQRQYFIGEITFMLIVGIGLYEIFRKLKWISPVLIAVSLISIEIFSNLSIVSQKSSRVLSSQIAKVRMSQVEPNSLIICTNDVDCYSLFFESIVKKTRQDVTILSHSSVYNKNFLMRNPHFYPYDDFGNPDYFAQLISWNMNQRPVYLTSGVSFYPDYIGFETGPFYLKPEGLLLKITTDYPEISSASSLPSVLKPITTLDYRDKYGKGIVEVMANNQAYAGYLSLVYKNTSTATKYLKNALYLDPNNSQALKLHNNLQQYAEELAFTPKPFSASSLVVRAKELESQNELESAETLLRYASYLEPKNPSILDDLITFYQKSNQPYRANIIINHKQKLK